MWKKSLKVRYLSKIKVNFINKLAAQTAQKADSCTYRQKPHLQDLIFWLGYLDWLFKMIRIYIGRRGVSWVEWSGVDVVSDAFKFRPWQDYSMVSIIRPGRLRLLEFEIAIEIIV